MKTILLTGGSGSFGRAYIQHTLAHSDARIVSVSRNAEQRYRLQQDFPDSRLIVVPGDVRHLEDLLDATFDYQIDTIIHASAEKHVGTGQAFTRYTRSVNVGGAAHVVALARLRKIPRILALSTDKACNPVNEYGRSKADAEKLFIKANDTGPMCSVVRYGNVVASSGSVLPLFIQQRSAGRLTVTDIRMTRYFMSLAPASSWQVIQEPNAQPVMSAVGLVNYALEHMAGGEVFIPHIPSGTILDLAQQIGPDCVIEEIGIRDGEKLHEELIAPHEASRCWMTRDGVYVLMPNESSVPFVLAERVPQGFSYASDHDPQPLKVCETVAA